MITTNTAQSDGESKEKTVNKQPESTPPLSTEEIKNSAQSAADRWKHREYHGLLDKMKATDAQNAKFEKLGEELRALESVYRPTKEQAAELTRKQIEYGGMLSDRQEVSQLKRPDGTVKTAEEFAAEQEAHKQKMEDEMKEGYARQAQIHEDTVEIDKLRRLKARLEHEGSFPGVREMLRVVGYLIAPEKDLPKDREMELAVESLHGLDWAEKMTRALGHTGFYGAGLMGILGGMASGWPGLVVGTGVGLGSIVVAVLSGMGIEFAQDVLSDRPDKIIKEAEELQRKPEK
ncbi:MAG: hypothetical protein WC775_04170 [Patescibacteria group bacterium]|jgi:hypothetical protein